MKRSVFMTCLMINWIASQGLVFAGVNDIKPSPILNLIAGISFELIDSIKSGQVPLNGLITVFTEEDRKNVPVLPEERFTPLCAAAHGKQLSAIKQLVAIGADVNSMCVNGSEITNPLQLAYGTYAQLGKETDITKALQSAGAKVFDGWIELDRTTKALTEYRDAESRKQALENLQSLASIAFQVAKTVGTAGLSDGKALGNVVIENTKSVSLQEQAEAAAQPENPGASKLREAIKQTPLTKNIHRFFQDEGSGKAWCTGAQTPERLIEVLQASNAVLVQMKSCRCEKTQPQTAAQPYVCGITYADKPKTSQAIGNDIKELSNPNQSMPPSGASSPAPTGRVNSASSTMVNAFASTVINRTTNIIASAVTGDSSTGGLGNLGSALLNQAITDSPQAVMTPDAAIVSRRPAGLVSNTPGTVQLQYTPGKGFLDPVTGKYIKTMEAMSCDNVTTHGIKIRDLPPDQRACVETAKNTVGQTIMPASVSGASTPAPAATAAKTKTAMTAATMSHKSDKTGGGSALDPAFNSSLGNVAQLEKVDPPEGMSFRSDRMYATNDGVYLALADTNRQFIVGKRTLGRSSVSGWLTSKYPKEISNFSVSSLKEEGQDEFSMQWVSSNGRYGTNNMNNNGIAVNFEKDLQSVSLIPTGAKMSQSFHWAIANGSEIWLESFGGGGYPKFSQRYKRINDEPISVYADMAVTDEEGTTLFVPKGDRTSIWEITASKRIIPHDLSSFGSGTVNTLIAAHNRLWIGYGDQILTLLDGKISPFAKMNGVFALHHPLFCLDGTTLFSADGQVRQGVNITPSEPHSFIQNSPNIRREDFATVTEIKTALSLGMYCAESRAWGPVIYAMGSNLGTIEQKLFIIRPK